MHQVIRDNLHRFQQPEAFLPFPNPTFGNPDWAAASGRVLIVRLSPLRDVDRSTPHLFLFQQVRRQLPGAWIDLAFFPPAAERAFFAAEGVPFLIGTQSLRAAADFDVVLITNAYVLELANLPYLLLHSRIPLWSSQRDADWPPFVLGGSNALACQALLRAGGDAMVDAVFFGEGEGVAGPLAQAMVTAPRAGRREALAEFAAQSCGLWIAGTEGPVDLARCDPARATAPLAGVPVLNTPAARTGSLQISYGCPAFCSFCFEGYERKPYRQVPLARLLEAARRTKQAQGTEELNLHSFCANAHSDIFALLHELQPRFDRIGLKSQRVDLLAAAAGLVDAECAIGKRSFSLGVEGISQRQRTWLHKSLGAAELDTLLDGLLQRRVREVKLFYLLTGNESPQDLAEFHGWVRGLRARARGTRVIFSFGLLIRMPFTPLQYDRLRLDEGEWEPLVEAVRAVCTSNGFAFRLAFDFAAYCTSQVLALGGDWLSDIVIDLAARGFCFDAALARQYWPRFRAAMQRGGHWNAAFLGPKPAGYAFPLAFVRTGVSADFLFRQFMACLAFEDSGYCLGAAGRNGHCQVCGACAGPEQRRAITHHRVAQPQPGPYQARLEQTATAQRRLAPLFVRVRLDPALAHAEPEFRDAVVFRGLVRRLPEWTDRLLRVRESLYAVGPDHSGCPVMHGESVFSLTAWDPADLARALPPSPETRSCDGFAIVGHEPDFTPGAFVRLDLEIRLPRRHFPDPRRGLEAYLREQHVPYALCREATGYRLEVAPKGRRKKVLLDGSFAIEGDDFGALLAVGPRFDPMAFVNACGPRGTHLYADVAVRRIECAKAAAVRQAPG